MFYTPCPREVPLPSVRLVRFAKVMALIADVSTLFCIFLIVAWQTTIFLRDGSWRALPLSLVFSASNYDQGEVYSTASIDKIVTGQFTNIAEALLQLPIITILLLGAAALTTFYSWISAVEKELTNTPLW